MGKPARRLLARHASRLERLLRHRDQLADEARGQQASGPQAPGQPDRMVLTHGEPHPGNFIQVGQQWMLVDWDTALIAPPERDLWLLDPGDGSVIDACVATGREISPPMLDLYRLTWEFSDIVGCVTRFRASTATRPGIARSGRSSAAAPWAGHHERMNREETRRADAHAAISLGEL